MTNNALASPEQVPFDDAVSTLEYNDVASLPARQIPACRAAIACNAGVNKNVLVTAWGGIGDHVAAEPTLRYILKTFKDCKVSLSTLHPEFYEHLKFDKVFNLNHEMPKYSDFLRLDTYVCHDERGLFPDYVSHPLTHAVDFSSLCALRRQLPNKDKEIQLPRREPSHPAFKELPLNVLVHAGRHWQANTFPKDWWDAVIARLVEGGVNPILIGQERTVIDFDSASSKQGVVGLGDYKCIDLRNRTSLTDLIWLCQNAKVVLSSDSGPMHIAASGDAWIGFVGGCKHPDLITHWRHGELGWRTKNFVKGGVWDLQDYAPYNTAAMKIDQEVSEEVLRSWLPSPEEYADWAIERVKESA